MPDRRVDHGDLFGRVVGEQVGEVFRGGSTARRSVARLSSSASEWLASRLETAAFAFGLPVVALLLLLLAVGQVRSRVRTTVVAAAQPPSAVGVQPSSSCRISVRSSSHTSSE